MTIMIFVPDFDKPNDIIAIDVVKEDEFYYYGSGKNQAWVKANVFPLAAKDAVIDICNKRYELFKAYKDSDALIYQLHNSVKRGEFK